MGAVVGVCHWPGQSETPASERIFNCRKSGSRAHLPVRMRLSDPERSTFAEIGDRLGRSALQQVACVAKPGTILAWYRRLIARRFDGSKNRTSPGRPAIKPELEALIVRFARENSGWGYDRIVGALANLRGHVAEAVAGVSLVPRVVASRLGGAEALERAVTAAFGEGNRGIGRSLGGLSLANAFAYGAFVTETGVEPFDHLAFPIGDVG
jgi:hypothetical protein